MLSENRINIQPGFTRVVLLVISLYKTLMMTPFFPSDNVSYGLAKLGETETDVLPWKKTRRREASTSNPAARRCPIVVRTVTFLVCVWQFIVQDQTVLCTAGLLFRLISGISAMFQYWCRWLLFPLPGRRLVLPF